LIDTSDGYNLTLNFVKSSLISILNPRQSAISSRKTSRKFLTGAAPRRRVNSDESVPIFERIGIDRIIDPHDIALKVLVKNALSPYAADLLDKISLFKDINLGQFQLSQDSPIVEKSIVETSFRDKTGASIVAVWREGEMHPNPSPDEVLQENDVLLVMGTASQLNRAKALVERWTG
jgi:Trk K+ transport system NAD-binding subunit